MATKTVELTDEKIKELREKISKVLMAAGAGARLWCIFCGASANPNGWCFGCGATHSLRSLQNPESGTSKAKLNEVVEKIIKIIDP